MKRCDGWPTVGCREQATEIVHGYKLCAGCARKFNAPDPHEARTQRILAAHAPQAVDADLELQIEEQDYISERQIAGLKAEIKQLRDQLESAQTSAVRAREEIDAYRSVISDATKRYSYIYDGWRKAQNNEEIADAVRKAMFDWEATRDRLYTEQTR